MDHFTNENLMVFVLAAFSGFGLFKRGLQHLQASMKKVPSKNQMYIE